MASLSETLDSMAQSSLEARSIDEARPLRVVVMGAGISGILASIRFPQRIQNLSLTVYEKNADIGGTWFENRYPGCACDIPAHTYQATFEPNHAWSRFYASSAEIHQYWKNVAIKYDCFKYIKLRQKVVEASWNEGSSQWNLKVRGGIRGFRLHWINRGAGGRCQQWNCFSRLLRSIDFRHWSSKRLEVAEHSWPLGLQRTTSSFC
jgi:hypothetical protein